MEPISISSLRPSEEDVDIIRNRCRDELANGCDFAELIEAFANSLSEDEEKAVMAMVLHARNMKIERGGMGLYPFPIGASLVDAFIRHVNKYAESEFDAELDRYADTKAAELQERGRIVDFSV